MSKHLHQSLCSETMQERCIRARQLERAGNYEAAREALGDLWRGIGKRPDVDGLDKATAAEVLLCAGTISGRLASAKQIGTQEGAKDLLSESCTLFEVIGNFVKAAEARIELGHCYWLTGAYEEARIALEVALRSAGEKDAEQRALGLLRLAVVEITANRFTDALRLLNEAEPLVMASSSDFLKR